MSDEIRTPQEMLEVLATQAAEIERLTQERDELLDKIENACQAMSETQPSWEWRAHAVVQALGFNYGGATPDLPDEDSWHARNLRRAENRATAAEAEMEIARKKLRYVIEERDKTFNLMLARAKAAEAEVERLKALLAECADDLSAYVDGDYPLATRLQYPDMKRRYDRDMEIVRRARLAAARQT